MLPLKGKKGSKTKKESKNDGRKWKEGEEGNEGNEGKEAKEGKEARICFAPACWKKREYIVVCSKLPIANAMNLRKAWAKEGNKEGRHQGRRMQKTFLSQHAQHAAEYYKQLPCS